MKKRKAKAKSDWEQVQEMVADGRIDREFIEDSLIVARIPKAQYERIVDEVRAKTDGLFQRMVMRACKKWVARQKSGRGAGN